MAQAPDPFAAYAVQDDPFAEFATESRTPPKKAALAPERPSVGAQLQALGGGRADGSLGNFFAGAVKGAGRTATGLGRFWHMIPGVSPAVDALYSLAGMDVNSDETFARSGEAESQLGLDPDGAAQRLGMLVEQLAELMVTGAKAETAATWVAGKVAPHLPAALRGAATLGTRATFQGAASAGVTAAQGGDVKTAAVIGGALPVAGKVASAVGKSIGKSAVPLVRAAIKPTVTAAKQQAGASAQGLNAQTDRLARFILKNRLTTAAKAQTIVDDAEREVQRLVSAGTLTDAPARAARYLEALKRSAAKQGLPAGDVATIQSAARELIKSSPMGETVTRTVMRPSPSGLVTASGQPVMVATQQTSRALRNSMPADEALATARASSRWATRKSWGEQKGAATEAAKAVERAGRDAVKTAVPATRPVLQRQGLGIQSRNILDRMAFREANRDAASLPAHVIAAGELASGRPPIMAFAANWLRNNQMKVGIWADRLASALARNDVKEVTTIMGRLGVAGTAQTTNPAYGR